MQNKKKKNHQEVALHENHLKASSASDLWSERLRCLVWKALLPILVSSWIGVATVGIQFHAPHPPPPWQASVVWIAAQWIPWIRMTTRQRWQQHAWHLWETTANEQQDSTPMRSSLDIPEVDVQAFDGDSHALKQYLEATYGSDWRRRPLLLKRLWTSSQLADPNRHLSVNGLLQESLKIPYFTDARRSDALTPDAYASIQSIVRNMTSHAASTISMTDGDGSSSPSSPAPHKIGSQLLVQTYPELIYEVVPPNNVLTDLFGNYFTPQHVKGMGPFQMLPGITTVPVFVAHGQAIETNQSQSKNDDHYDSPFTGLHCEPIGNIAVQLSGQKQWTLIGPEFSYRLRPALATDGRAYFASHHHHVNNRIGVVVDNGHDDDTIKPATVHHLDDDQQQQLPPHYDVSTVAGDAIWVPPWMWHQVVYLPHPDLAMGGSLFHFRLFDYVTYHPLFAMLIVPAILLEVVGYKTQ